jgi:hypothetical protein
MLKSFRMFWPRLITSNRQPVDLAETYKLITVPSPHTVAMSDVSQIDDDSRTGLNPLVDFSSKKVAGIDHQASGAVSHSCV